MAIDSQFAGIFGQLGQTTTAKTKEDRPQAKVWLNIGYEVDVKVDDGQGGTKNDVNFVSLPVGIPADTMEAKPLPKGKNQQLRNLVAAQNNLLGLVKAAAEKLQPGESGIIPLKIQLRRVEDEAAPANTADNPFIVDLAM